MADDRYDRVSYDGKTLDKYTLAAIHECERRLGYPLSIVQGSYNAGGVGASAGTHDGGGAVDLLPWDWQNKVHVLRSVGFAAWHRPTIPGLWNEHIHCIQIGNAKASSAAKAQVTDYRNHKDGLADHAADNSWHPDPIPTFVYPGTVTPPPPPPRHRRRRRSYFVDLHPTYQAGFNFNLAATEGIRAVVIKCTEGEGVNYGTGYTSMIAHAQAADLGVAAYHWLHGGDTGYLKRQAQNLAAHIGDTSIPVFIDAERGGASPTVKDIAGFIVAARDLGLNVVGLYLPRWYWSSLGSPSLTGLDVTLWNSAYGPNLSLPPKAARIANLSPGRWDLMGGKKPQLLQFGSRVKVGGLSLDCDVYRGPAADLSRWFKMPQTAPPPPPPPTPKPPVTIRHAHSSGRYDRPPSSLHAEVLALAADVDLITVTEVSAEPRGHALAEKGWVHYRGPNTPGADECAILWNAGVFKLVAADSVQVTDLTYDQTDGHTMAPVHVAVAVLEHLATGRTTLVTVGHYPSDVQGASGPEGIWNSAVPKRVAAHKSAVAGTRALVEEWVAKYQPDAVAISGDWNLNIANAKVRAWFAEQFPGYVPNWPAKPTGRGTLGHRWIDVAFLDGLQPTGQPTVHTTDASDHRYYIETLESE